MRILNFLWLLPWTPLFSAEPQPIAVANFDAPATGGVLDAAPVFLAEDSVALLVRDHDRVSEILVFRLAEGNLRLVAKTGTFVSAEFILAASGKRPLVTSRRGEAMLYSSDLGDKWEVPRRERLIKYAFPGSGIIGEGTFVPRGTDRWELIELGPEMRTIRKGTGSLRSVSDQAIAVLRETTLFFESLDGKPLGSMPVPGDSRGRLIGEIAGENRFLLDSPKDAIFSFQGKLITPVSRPPGWGFRRGWSADGRRLLLDHYTRKVSAVERAIEALASVIVPVPEQSDGELIRVIDTAQKKGCFQLVRTRGTEFTLAGNKHADISPSGRLVVVATLSKLSVYRLPEACGSW